LATALVFGALHQVQLLTAREHPLRNRLVLDQQVWAEIEGHFEQVPADVEGGTALALGFDAREVRVPHLELECRGQTRLKAWFHENEETGPKQGGRYRLTGYLTLSPPARNPSLFRPEDAALRKGVIGRILVEHWELLEAKPWDLSLRMVSIAQQCRDWLAQQITLTLEDEPEVCAFLQLMALGASDLECYYLEDAFRDSGTLHIFSVSGLHVGMIAFIAWQFLAVLRCPRRVAWLIIAPAVLGYAFITGWQSAAARSGIMAVVLLLAPAFARQPSMVNSIGAAALVLLIMDTQQVFHPGFQLSFLIVLIMTWLTPLLHKPFLNWVELDPFLPEVLATRWQRLGRWWRSWLLSSLCTSAAAWLGSLPLMLWHFHSVTPIALLANLVQVPLSFFCLITAALAVLCAVGTFHSAQILFNQANWAFAKLTVSCAQLFASVPGGNYVWQSMPESGLVSTVNVLSLPEGHGAFCLQDAGQTWMMDCGSELDVARAVLPFLRYQGVQRLGGLLLTHADTDHAGGAVILMQRCMPDAVYAGVHEPWELDTRRTALWKVQRKLEEQQRKLQPVQEGTTLTLGDMNLRTLYPQPRDGYAKADDRCLVIQLQLGQQRLLFCHDMGYLTEQTLINRYPTGDLKSTILLCEQHAADGQVSASFLDLVLPQYVICGSKPSASLKDACEKRRIKLLQTQPLGMIQIQPEGPILQLKAWLTGQKWQTKPEPIIGTAVQ
jgi:ComEC/Rec2-related protein